MTVDFLLDYYKERIVIRLCGIFAVTFKSVKEEKVFIIMEEALAVILPAVCEEEIERGVVEKLYDAILAGVKSQRTDLIEFLETGRQKSLALTSK